MKVNPVLTIIAIVASALIAFGFYSWCKWTDMNLLIAIVGGFCNVLTFGTLLGVRVEQPRVTINIKVISGIFAGLLLISNVVFCCLNSFSLPLYIIVNGLLLLMWLLLIYNISRSLK